MITPKIGMALPYTTFLFKKIPDGWQDLGEANSNTENRLFCSFCGRRVHIGRTSYDEVFKFCPRCRTVLEIANADSFSVEEQYED